MLSGFCSTTIIRFGFLEVRTVDSCTVGSTIQLTIDGSIGNYFGSVFLTCTEYGWFPDAPIIEDFPLGENYFHIFFLFKMNCAKISYQKFISKTTSFEIQHKSNMCGHFNVKWTKVIKCWCWRFILFLNFYMNKEVNHIQKLSITHCCWAVV